MDVKRTGPGLDAVRALHQTVVALRAALEQSKSEITQLKSKVWPIETVKDALQALSIENHILREKLINSKKEKEISSIGSELKEGKNVPKHEDETNDDRKQLKGDENSKKVTIISPRKLEAKISVKAELKSSKNTSKSLESLTVFEYPYKQPKKITFTKTISFANLTEISREFTTNEDAKMSVNKEKSESDTEGAVSPQNEPEQEAEVDDIELIFTTDDTKESDFKEQLVSIEGGDSSCGDTAANLLQLPLSDLDHLDVSDRELDDDVFNDETDNFKTFPAKRDNSFMNSKSDNSINHDENKSFKSYYSFQDSSFENKSLEKDESFDRFEERIRIVETDISKCGIHEVEYIGNRRNTCPNPIQYRPLSHREALARGLNTRKGRPIFTNSNAIRKESGAQTDISALPNSSWRSESSLANKARVGDNFTTLPSKFPLPGSRLRLSEKTVEARRVLLSDIGFTSMVPELSRSADHLCPQTLKPPTTYGQFLRTTDLYSPGCMPQKFNWTATPSESSQTQSRYSSMYPLSSPPAPSRRCSAPVSPSRRVVLKPTPSKVRFAVGSLPELRSEWNTTIDSGDSTDSLVEEAENYLRRSIDCIMIGRDATNSCCEHKRTVPRRASAPEPARDNVPPQGWQPFLPRVARDLKPDHWVKVITPEGRVRGGRVRYVGPVVTQTEPFVGVQLGSPDGCNDGTYNGRRYFQCESYHGIFVPFKKVIMGWRP